MSAVTEPATEPFNPRWAVTFGEVAILHVGGAEMGEGIREHGFSVPELERFRTMLAAKGAECELVDVSAPLPTGEMQRTHAAATLVVRNGAQFFCDVGSEEAVPNVANMLRAEQQEIPYDRKFWNARQRKTLNKRARLNTTFGPTDVAASEDFRQPTVHKFPPHLAAFRAGLEVLLGPKASGLNAEGNHYFERKSGIGFHGDAERKIVICLSLGGASVLRYHWRTPGSSEHTLPPVDLRVGHGDVYIMSEKATGFDWKHRSKVRVVHGAGLTSTLPPRRSARNAVVGPVGLQSGKRCRRTSKQCLNMHK